MIEARARNKVAIVTLFHGRGEFHDLTSPIKRAYAERHGYDYYEPSQEILREVIARHPEMGQDTCEKDPYYCKIPALLVACDNHDWAMWQDADSFFMNHNFRITDVLDERYHAIFPAMHHHLHHPHNNWINSGNFLIRCSPLGIQLLKESYNMGITNDDQMAIQVRIGQNSTYADMSKYVKHRLLNSMPECDWAEKDFVIHFPGGGPNKFAYLQEISKLVTY
jgi:hypothetical protein